MSNYTRFFEEIRKYGCNKIYLNGMKVTNRKIQDDSRNLSVMG
jgi:hypothetical protein